MLQERNRWSLEFRIGLPFLWNSQPEKYKRNWYYPSTHPRKTTNKVASPHNTPKNIAITQAKGNLTRQRHPIPAKIMQAVHELRIEDNQHKLPPPNDVLEMLQRIQKEIQDIICSLSLLLHPRKIPTLHLTYLYMIISHFMTILF